ncbi:MAG TPA: SurA N-terminal domain-containing protein [Steroidobacteraceae bacterium]|nr:SurA N-terminal domain-containing protein [Steroidobacteraceae bacterium]
MLQTIHDRLKGIFAIAILVALGVVFVFWGINFSTDFGGFTSARGIEVNGREVPVEDVRQNYQDQLSRMQAAFGEAGVPDEMRAAMQKRVLEQAVRTELIRQRTRKLGFEATDAEVLEAIRQVPAFQVDGKFSSDAYHAALRSINMSPERFEAEQRDYVLARQLDRGLYSSAFVLPAEVERQVALSGESRTLGWIAIPAREFEPEVALDDAAIGAYYEANKARYMSEEQATVDFVELDIETYAARADVSEPALRAYYEENKARYTQAGRRHARHILFAAGNDDAAAEANAKRAYARAAAGEDFAALARELSEDPGSKDSGGDLGEAERADFVGPFADAVWSMKPGEVRGPVKTEFGWHVIKLESASPEVTKSFEDVRAELEPEYRRNQVEKAFGDAQEELDTAAFEAQGDIGAVAAKLGLPVRRIERYTRAGSAELGATPKVTEAVFSPEVIAGRELRTVELSPGKVVALGVTAHEPARSKPLAEVRAEVVESARLEAAGKLSAARAKALVAELEKGAAWSSTVERWAGEARTQVPRAASRQEPAIPAEIRDAAFRAARPAGGKPGYGTATLGNGDTAVWTVTAAEPGKLAPATTPEGRKARDDARDRVAMTDATAYISAMRARSEIDVNPKLFE